MKLKIFLAWVSASTALMAQVDTSQSQAQAQAAQAYQQSRAAYITALSQAGYNASEFILPENPQQNSAQMVTVEQMQANFNLRSQAAASAVGAITKEHRAMDYNKDKIAVLQNNIRALQLRYKPDAKNRLADEVFKSKVHDQQVRILNIKLAEAPNPIAERQLETLMADPLVIIVDDPELFPVDVK